MTHFLLLLLLNFFSLNLLATSPNKQTKPEKTQIAYAKKIYVNTLYFSEKNELALVKFVWIPPVVQDKCFGGSFLTCEDLSSANRSSSSIPYSPQTLSAQPESDLSKKIIQQIKLTSWYTKLIKENINSTIEINISKDKFIVADIMWEFWGNGENSKIIKLVEN